VEAVWKPQPPRSDPQTPAVCDAWRRFSARNPQTTRSRLHPLPPDEEEVPGSSPGSPTGTSRAASRKLYGSALRGSLTTPLDHAIGALYDARPWSARHRWQDASQWGSPGGRRVSDARSFLESLLQRLERDIEHGSRGRSPKPGRPASIADCASEWRRSMTTRASGSRSRRFAYFTPRWSTSPTFWCSTITRRPPARSTSKALRAGFPH